MVVMASPSPRELDASTRKKYGIPLCHILFAFVHIYSDRRGGEGMVCKSPLGSVDDDARVHLFSAGDIGEFSA